MTGTHDGFDPRGVRHPVPTPSVSVGVFGYNHERYIVDAVQSVVDSSFQDWELFIVDDGSSDGTFEVVSLHVEDLADPRIRLIADGMNTGLAARLNQVTGLASGEWLAVLGGDDAYLPEGLATLVSGFEDGIDVVWGDLEVVDVEGASKGYARPRDTWQGSTARKYRTPAPPGLDILEFNNFVSGTSPLIRLQALRQVGGYTEGVRNEDLDLWLRMGRDHSFRYVDAPVARYRVVPGSSSRSEAAALRDQAEIVGRMVRADAYPRDRLARLLAMRWALSLGRSHGRSAVPLRELAAESGLSIREIGRQAPRAGFDPVALSVGAFVRRHVRS